MAKVKKPIVRNGKTVGYKVYKTGGLFGENTFVGYEWKKKKKRKKK